MKRSTKIISSECHNIILIVMVLIYVHLQVILVRAKTYQYILSKRKHSGLRLSTDKKLSVLSVLISTLYLSVHAENP